jgi:8-oxo-dGTP pyrophosphatase MutT (NUDIX family)
MVRQTDGVAVGGHLVRRASTVCLVRDGDQLEVLMVQRPFTSRVMPGGWVFPGGAVDDSDADPPMRFGPIPHDDWKVAALRELIEETGIWLTSVGAIDRPTTDDAFGDVASSEHMIDPNALIYFSHWITPKVFPVRFDTRFYVSHIGNGVHGQVDGDELIDLAWVNPHDALENERKGEWEVAFPTRETLKLFAAESSAADIATKFRATAPAPPVEPRLFVSETEVKILVPGDAGYESAGPSQDDPTILSRLSAFVSKGGPVPAEFRSRP